MLSPSLISLFARTRPALLLPFSIWRRYLDSWNDFCGCQVTLISIVVYVVLILFSDILWLKEASNVSSGLSQLLDLLRYVKAVRHIRRSVLFWNRNWCTGTLSCFQCRRAGTDDMPAFDRLYQSSDVAARSSWCCSRTTVPWWSPMLHRCQSLNKTTSDRFPRQLDGSVLSFHLRRSELRCMSSPFAG